LGLIWATDHAFSQLGVNKVYARIVPGNLASIRVAEKCGYEREGLLRSDFRTATAGCWMSTSMEGCDER
jgi:RimJ/RimL family protein N-acetyltransferase